MNISDNIWRTTKSNQLNSRLSGRSEFVQPFSKLIAISLLMAGLCFPHAAIGDTLRGRVVSVADGDTITVLSDEKMQHRIRLAGIDAPELKQAFGKASRQHLALLVAGKPVLVEWHKRDRYGRIVGKVFQNGSDVCLAQVRAGMAWWFKRYAGEQTEEDRKRYAGAEQQARVERVGLWQEARPIPPWSWRAQKNRKITLAPASSIQRRL